MRHGSTEALPEVSSLVAVVAHPDDESFGLGAALASFAATGTRVEVLCFTRGEASTLGGVSADLASVRAEELRSAATVLGVSEVRLLSYTDGGLDGELLGALAERVVAEAEACAPDLLLVMDTGGITGHPDHQRATQATLVAADLLGIAVLAWVLRDDVALRLREEFSIPFVGRSPAEIDITLEVDRGEQLRAIARHRSQSAENRVLWRRLELQGTQESFCWLRPPRQ
jgi:N-acetylglucosamine malate deacetylase 2